MVRDLRTRRLRMGLTQAQLARALYVDRMSISQWERGRARPSLPGLVEEKLARMEAEREKSRTSP